MSVDVATALFTSGRTDEALALCQQHLKANPADAGGWGVLGAMFHNIGRYRSAAEALQRSLQLRPDDPQVMGHLAAALKGMGDLEAAEKVALKSLAIWPDNAELLNSYGGLLNDMHRAFEAEEAFRRSIAADPAAPKAYGNLAYTLFLLGRNSEGEVFARRGLKIDPDSAVLQNSMGSSVMGQDRMVEAATYFRKAVELDPDFAIAHSNLLFCRNYDPDASAEDVFADYRRFDELQCRPLVPSDPHYENDRDPDRRIRLGFVSPDFRRHAANYFLEPLLEAHDRDRFELFLYGMVPAPDRYTDRYRELAHAWRNVTGISDEEMVEQIRQDRIDILVDFAGHTARNRLKVFARRPAPVQIAYLVGLGYTTGMSVFDGFFADDAMAPPDAGHLFSEPVLRLGRFPMTYRPPAEMPEVGPLPAEKAGHVTFASFSRTVRINARVVDCWAEILKAVPTARLMLNTKSFAEEAARNAYRQMFARRGVDPDRLQLLFTQPQSVTWETYNRVDIALDPFPHNAGTTTFEALWMGVPVVSRMDRPSVGRFGASIMNSLGQPGWVARDDADYVRRAVALAADLPALARTRAGLRSAMRQSPLMDPRGLAAEMEAHYRRLWRGWCTGRTEPAPSWPTPDFLLYRGSATAPVPASSHTSVSADASVDPSGGPQAADATTVETLLAASRGAEAFRMAARLSAERPDDIDLLHLVSRCLDAADRPADAASVRAQAAALAVAQAAPAPDRPQPPDLVPVDLPVDPGDAGTLRRAAEKAHAEGRLDAAEAGYKQLLALVPDDAAAANNMAAICLEGGRAAAAEGFARRALKHAADSPQVVGNLAMALCEQAQLAEGLPMLQRLVDSGKASARTHANLLFAQNYDPDRDAATIRRTAEAWAARFAPAGGRQELPRSAGAAAAGRRLRVGYVSPDFRIHATLNFLLPLLQAHDRGKVEVHLFAELSGTDAASAMYRAAADGWHETAGRSDDDLAALVREIGIDVLVDLAGHTSAARLGLFARRPAPVQLTYPIGFGGTTGMAQFDGVIADRVLAPEVAETGFTEPALRVDGPWVAFRPQSPFPNVGALPAAANGHVTFGCFSRVIRLNDRVLDCWAEILAALPGSRLMLNNRVFQEAAVRTRFLAAFHARGIGADRLDLVYVTPQAASLSHYGKVDITLDPFPHSAATTVAESLWMGVPVVSLRGATPVGRLGASLLEAGGLEAWVADSPEAYVDIALQLAGDTDRLTRARAGLREHVQGGPMADHGALAARLEALYLRLGGAPTGGPDPGAGPAAGSPVSSLPPPDTGSAQPAAVPTDGAAKASALMAAGRPAEAVDLLRAAVSTGGASVAELLLYLVAAIHADRLPEDALQLAERLVGQALGDPGHHNIHAIVLRRAGRTAEAEAAFRQAVALDPRQGEAAQNLCSLLMGSERYGEAETLMATYLEQRPDDGRGWITLGQARQMQMDTRGAIAAYERGLALVPDDYEGWSNLCPMRIVLEDFEGAVAAGRRAIQLRPGVKKDLTNLGVAEYRQFNLKEAERLCLESIRIDPNHALTWNNLANIYLDECRFDQAFDAYRRAVHSERDGVQHHSNLLFALNYAPDMSAEEIFAEYRNWDERHARPLVPAQVRHDNDRDPGRRLRIGYASPDFRSHAARNFLLPMLEGHDRGAVELVLYSETPAPDEVTAQYRALADQWRETYDLNDDRLAARIREDRIDIMIDLASHTAGNRLLAMVRRPAPILISLMVGLGYTTGISGFDYFVGDGDMTPPEAAHLFGEQALIRLNRFPMAYRARPEMPQPNRLPALQQGHVTFGSLSRTMRLNDHVVAAWARILKAVPGSRLVLNNKPYHDPAVRDLFVQRFVAQGIDPSRLKVFRGTVDYREIDIALDPWPHNAGTTTCEALWMGVPVLSRRDRPSVGRFGVSILRATGLSDWAVDDTEAYVARAVAAAADLDGLARLRAGLRDRMAASPLCDGSDLARQMEAAFRVAWQRWCRGEGATPITVRPDGTARAD
ncbi:tetratricopeptide repeat protein [Marinibaculum pumilum]|uniref:protein O-GlcNAc transferase n=1 Tax=Marinibaculum pumilum TaxID=1766165 RepID=A0ABV7L6S7_9PROT